MRVTHGEYSSYHERGWFVAVQEFCPEDELAAYMELHPEQREGYTFKDEAFFGWVHGKGYLAECHVFFDEWYMGDYSQYQLISYTPRAAESRGAQS